MKCSRRAKHTPNPLNLHTVWLYDLRALPSRGWFYFPAFNGPLALGARAPRRWRERETRFFDPWIHQKGPDVQLFSLWWSWEGACASLMSASQHTGCCCSAMIIGGNDVMLDLGPHTHRRMGYRGGRCPQRILWIKPRLCKHFCLCSLDLMAHAFVWEMTICSEATLQTRETHSKVF